MNYRKKVLIFTTPADVHGSAVSWALKRWGISHDVINFSEYPANVVAKISVSPNGMAQCDFGDIGGIHAESYAVVWDRRGSSPTASSLAHKADKRFILAESRQFIKSFRAILSSGSAIWINNPSKANHANNKAVQLITAAKLGFSIPETLISNSPSAVMDFFERHTRLIAKQFCQLQWMDADTRKTYPTKTTEIQRRDIVDEEPIRYCANIFQPVGDIKYEVRVTVIGDFVLAARIDSQMHGPLIDWREAVAARRLTVSNHELPPDIREKCLRFCSELGLRFGCIDLIVTREDQYVFLELNHTGQWLWKEANDPQIAMLQHFTSYIAELAGCGAESHQVGYLEYLDSAEHREYLQTMEANKQQFNPESDLFIMVE